MFLPILNPIKVIACWTYLRAIGVLKLRQVLVVDCATPNARLYSA